MGWLRARQGWGAGLALIALTLQLVLSFGHTHRTGHAISSVAVADNFRAADNDPGDAATGICQICFTLAQTAAGSTPAPTPLALSLNFAEALFADRLPPSIAATPPAAFWSRGPPLS